MNPQHLLIDNACRIEVSEGNFTEGQKAEMHKILDKFRDTKQYNIFKITKYLKMFEDTFVKYGGNHDKLEKSIASIREDAYVEAIKKVPVLKIDKEKKTISFKKEEK